MKLKWKLNLLCGKDLISIENVEMKILRKSWVRKIVLLKGDFLQNTICIFIYPIKSFLHKQCFFQRLRYWPKNFNFFFKYGKYNPRIGPGNWGVGLGKNSSLHQSSYMNGIASKSFTLKLCHLDLEVWAHFSWKFWHLIPFWASSEVIWGTLEIMGYIP